VLRSIRDVDLAPAPRAGGAPAPPVAAASAVRPAGFWIRVAASLLDGLLFGVVLAPLSFVLSRSAIGLTFMQLLSLGLGLALALVGWGRYGTTPGKYVLRLAVCTLDGRPGEGIGPTKALIRWLGYLVSSVVLGLGFLLVAFHPEKRGLHDLIAGTRVVRRG
jgi:uncharacterized RDD family membrane protein YckC